MNEQKRLAALKASEYISDGMVVGLGTGSTAYYFIEELGRRVSEEGLSIIGVATSKRSEEQARILGIRVASVHEVDSIDITVDGVDEFDGDLNGIKGGGGALLFEKVVARYTKRNIWIADESKRVKKLGAFPLPVEVVPFASDLLFKRFEMLGYHPSWRKNGHQRYNTDSGNEIIDLSLGEIDDAYTLAEMLDRLTGVVEHGLFLDLVDSVIVASNVGVSLVTKGE